MNKILFSLVVLFTAQNLFAFQDLNTPRSFPKIESKAEWKNRAKEIREQILVSCGLWPMPARSPLKARVSDKVVRGDYTIEKVYFQSYPGFYVAGNLYRPVGQGPFPAILNPHGHWENGRMADTDTGSIAGRCINFAKQGMIAFSYDMVGYNDTFFPADEPSSGEGKNLYKRHRSFGTNDADLLWNINLMGLQTWNSIRALDFLESLPDVDQERLACTGESGGGTQTFILGAIDDRLAAQAPIVMVSHSMQGGCSCENAPGLRVEYSNMEIAAAAAPRPQLMVGATGDWTRTMLSVEGPNVASIYNLFHHGENLSYKIFNFPHNYNQTSREAVYEFFDESLKARHPAKKEAKFTKEPDAQLRVFPEDKLPDDAITEIELRKRMVADSIAQLRELKPKGKGSLADYKKVFLPAWKHTMQLVGSEPPVVDFTLLPQSGKSRGTVVLADPKGKSAFIDETNQTLLGLAKALSDRKFKVMVMNFPAAARTEIKQADLFFTTYNRTFAQERVRELVSACELARKSGDKVVLCGTGRAGLWTLLASPAADAVVADGDEIDPLSDAALLETELFIPGLRKLGSFEGVATLAAPRPLLLHDAGEKFPVSPIGEIYSSVKATDVFKGSKSKASDDEIANWIAGLTKL
ncbi:MAG: acetylxylan esterase [Verrucomicrobiota bacterium]